MFFLVVGGGWPEAHGILGPRPGMEGEVYTPGTERWILNHWTTREIHRKALVLQSILVRLLQRNRTNRGYIYRERDMQREIFIIRNWLIQWRMLRSPQICQSVICKLENQEASVWFWSESKGLRTRSSNSRSPSLRAEDWYPRSAVKQRGQIISYSAFLFYLGPHAFIRQGPLTWRREVCFYSTQFTDSNANLLWNTQK